MDLGLGQGLFCYGCVFVSQALKGDYVDVGLVGGGSSQSCGDTFGCSDGIMDGGFCWELGRWWCDWTFEDQIRVGGEEQQQYI